MNTLKPGRPPFTVLIMSEVSRLGREQIETAYAMKQLSVAGVAVLQLSGGPRAPYLERDRQVSARRRRDS
jgi:hypothetical protein